jgi:uncharacterized membrane protein
MKKWLLWTSIATLAFGIMVNILTVMAIPVVIMDHLLNRAFKDYAWNAMVYSPVVTENSRTVVRPSPDLLYSVCKYDISEHPLRVTVPVPPTYVSVACYDTNTDNYFHINDREVKNNQIELVLVKKGSSYPDAGSAVVVESPTAKGLVLIRMFITSEDKLDDLIRMQKQAHCEQ